MRIPVPGSPVGWYCTNSISFKGTPAWYARAIPSPVLMAALVVKEKIRPRPPVHRITAFAEMHRTSESRRSIAATPEHRPSSSRSEVTKNSSRRTIRSYLSEVWNRVCRRWKPVLSAANTVRGTLMPPNGRTASRPSGSRLHGQPQCSSWTISPGASVTKASTASWSAR